MAVSRRVRFEVLRRDNHQCRYCGAAAPDVPLVVDHVVPVALGGSDDPTNLVTACQDCNSGKTSTNPDSALVADIDAKAAQWAQAMAIVAQRRAADRERREQTALEFFDHWQSHRESQWKSADMAPGWENSLMTFLDAGLEVDDIKDLMVVALKTRTATDKWRYFCGCCWTRVRQAQEQAAQIVSQWEREEEAEEDRAAEAYVKQQREITEKRWREKFGTGLAWCLCGYVLGRPYCGNAACMSEIVALANGVLTDPSHVMQLVSALIEVEETKEPEEVPE